MPRSSSMSRNDNKKVNLKVAIGERVPCSRRSRPSTCGQSRRRSAANMLRLLLLLVLLTDRTRTAFVTNSPTFGDRLNKLYEKLERFTLSPSQKPSAKLYEKLDRLNSLMPDKYLTDDDEELLSAMQTWGVMSDEQLQGVMEDLQNMREDKSDKIIDGEYVDGDWNEEQDLDPELGDGDYANDVGEDWDSLDTDSSSTSRPVLGVTPSAFTKLSAYRHTIISAVDPIAATKERPRILDDSRASAQERAAIRKAALANIGAVVKTGKCLIPQARWYSVRKLAPAADTVYFPPCVQLHRCAVDSGCCHDEAEVCAPIDGKYVAIPFILTKVDSNLTAVRMMFFNHTRCACVSRETLETTARTRIEAQISEERRESSKEKLNDWRAPTEEPTLVRDEEQQTTPRELLRCTCPVLFKSHIGTDGGCSCTCDWPDQIRRRDCQSLSRGREHFGLRDRVCISRGECHLPACDHGAYMQSSGRCPSRRVKRRFNIRTRY